MSAAMCRGRAASSMAASRETMCSSVSSVAALGCAEADTDPFCCAAAAAAASGGGAVFSSPADAPRGATDGWVGARSFCPSPLLNMNIICSTLAASLEGGAVLAFNSAQTASTSVRPDIGREEKTQSAFPIGTSGVHSNCGVE